MDFLTLAHERYSCRKFQDRVVEQEKIDRIIDAGMAAPTAVNKQPVKIWVIQSQEARAKVAEATPFPFVKQAPVVFVLGGSPAESWVRGYDKKGFADVDAAIVGTHMILEVQALGLGTTWVGHFDPEKLKEQFPEMRDYNLIAMYPVGYPAEDSVPTKTHVASKEKSEMVSVL